MEDRRQGPSVAFALRSPREFETKLLWGKTFMHVRWRLLLTAVILLAGSASLPAPASAATGQGPSIQVSCNQIFYGFTGKNALEAGNCLAPGASLYMSWHWNSGRYQWQNLTYQEDGNLVLYRNVQGQSRTAIWASNTSGYTAGNLAMQTDGNLVLYNNLGQAYWATNTWNCWGDWGYKQLDMQSDENLVIYFWPRTGTGGKVAKWDRYGYARC